MNIITADKIGDCVRVADPRCPGVWRVVAKLQKNYRLEHVDTGRVIKCAPELLLPVDQTTSTATAEVIPLEEFFDPGETVKLNGRTDVYVVLKSVARGYQVAKLGGESGRYYTAPSAILSRVRLIWSEQTS